jgi:hypothetical protein
MGLSIASGLLFVHNLAAPEPNILAILLVIPLLCLRSAWKLDRQIRACDDRLSSFRRPPETSLPPTQR